MIDLLVKECKVSHPNTINEFSEKTKDTIVDTKSKSQNQAVMII